MILTLRGQKRLLKEFLKQPRKEKKVIIFGDSDLDGIASVVILKELFELLNPLYVQKKI